MLKKVYYILFIVFCMSLNVSANHQVDSLISLIDSTKHNSSQVEIYYKISDYYSNTDFKKSIIFAQKGGLIALELNDSLRIAKCLFNEGVGYTNLGLFRTSFDKLTECKHFYEAQADTSRLIECIKNIGNIFWFENNYTDALKHFREANNLGYHSGNEEFQPAIYTNIGIVYTSLSQNDSAIYYLSKAQKLIEKNNKSFELGMIYLNIGGFYDKINSDSAIYYYNKSLRYRNDLQTRLISFLYSSLAQIHIETHKINLAGNLLDSSLHYASIDNNLIALREYYKIKFRLDTTLGYAKNAIQSHLEFKAIEDSIHSKTHLKKSENYNTLYELNKRENEINQLRIDNEYYKINAEKNRFIIALLFIISILTFISFISYKRLNSEKKKAIISLNSKNEDLVNHKEELSTLNEEILVQREELYQNNKKLQKSIKQLQEAQIQVIQSEKLATIGLLASGVAHEINNPLNFISAGLQQLSEFYENNSLTDHQKDVLTQTSSIIEDGVLRAAKITEALGAINQPVKLEQTEVNINNIFRNTIKIINYKITDDIKFIENYGNIDPFYSYPDKIQSIIIHIIANAVEAIENQKSAPVKYLKISTWSINEFNDDKVCISIENSNDHLSKSALQKIFDPFYTTKESDKGVGLGLFIVYNLVTELEGTITVENSELGIVFRIEIPITLEKN